MVERQRDGLVVERQRDGLVVERQRDGLVVERRAGGGTTTNLSGRCDTIQRGTGTGTKGTLPAFRKRELKKLF